MKLTKLVMLTVVSSIILCIIPKIWSLRGEDRNFLGYWTGTLRIMESETELHLEFLLEGNELKGLITVPVQMMREFPLSAINIDYPDIYFELQAGVTASFTGSMKEGYISGSFSQPGGNGIFHVVRGEKQEMFAQDEKPGLSGESDKQIATRFGTIYGSLVVPELQEKMPVVLIIPGSGPTDRDGNSPLYGQGNFYRNLAQKLYEQGIASLRFDKRAVGASAQAMMKEEDLRFRYYVQDAVLWLQKLKQEERFSEIIVFGHSEGSLIGILAAQEEEIDGLISAAGAGRNMAEVMAQQFDRQPEPFKSEGLEILENLQKGVMVQEVSDELKPAFRTVIQPYLLSVFRFNPAEEIAKLEIPILIIQGRNDIQVTTEDAMLLAEANANAELKIIEKMNHVFRNSSTDMVETLRTYGNPEIPFSDGFLSSVIDFIKGLK